MREADTAPATSHTGHVHSMEQSLPVVLLQDVKKSYPLGHGQALQVLDEHHQLERHVNSARKKIAIAGRAGL